MLIFKVIFTIFVLDVTFWGNWGKNSFEPWDQTTVTKLAKLSLPKSLKHTVKLAT